MKIGCNCNKKRPLHRPNLFAIRFRCNRMSQRTSTPRGFTLVELLVVIGICALLIAILLPVLSLTRARARQTVCASNLGQLNLAFVMYAADHDGLLPPYNNNILYAHDQGETRHFPPHGDFLVASLWPYTHSPEVWFCPEDIFARNGPSPGVLLSGGLHIDHRLSSYETSWPLGMVDYPATIDGVRLKSRHGRFLELGPDFLLLSDEAVMKTGCGDWAYSHQGRVNSLCWDGHVTSATPVCSQ